MKRTQDLDNPVDWLVRAAYDRSLPEGATLWAHTAHGPELGEIEFAMAARLGVKARTVRQQLWARQVELTAGKGKLVSATCIVAREVGAPAGVKPIEWRLLTNRAATTGREIAQLIDWYRALGNRDPVQRPQKWLPGRGTATRGRRTHRTRARHVSGGVLAHRAPDEDGTHLSGSGRRTVLRP